VLSDGEVGIYSPYSRFKWGLCKSPSAFFLDFQDSPANNILLGCGKKRPAIGKPVVFDGGSSFLPTPFESFAAVRLLGSKTAKR
jgi:hypothetical protein